jgi:solute:Na+ symporter, SSS family
MTVFASGISMYAMAKLMEALLGWNFHFSILLSAAIVLSYTLLGGLTSAIYNEVLQFFLIVAGLTPLVFLAFKDAGGWDGIRKNLEAVAQKNQFAADAWTRSWAYMGDPGQNPLGVEWFGLVMGLGFVLSFGYWCTNSLVVQRAMAADSMSAARRTPLIGAIPKMFIPALVILPGMIAIALTQGGGVGAFSLPAKGSGYDYDMAIPLMLGHYLPAGVLGLGITALLASFMSGMAGNVTAFNAVWTYDIYQSYIRPGQPDRHYLKMGHMATVFGTVVSMGAAYVAASFNNLMDFLQLIFGFVNAPLFATFLLGMFWRRATGHGAFTGLLAGSAAAAITHGVTIAEGKGGWLGNVYGFKSSMAQNFWIAGLAWTVCFVVTIAASLATKRNRSDDELRGLVYSLTPRKRDADLSWYWQPATLAAGVLVAVLVLNIIFW